MKPDRNLFSVCSTIVILMILDNKKYTTKTKSRENLYFEYPTQCLISKQYHLEYRNARNTGTGTCMYKPETEFKKKTLTSSQISNLFSITGHYYVSHITHFRMGKSSQNFWVILSENHL